MLQRLSLVLLLLIYIARIYGIGPFEELLYDEDGCSFGILSAYQDHL